MGSRAELQTVLEDLLGSRNVYYQPPASVKMKYPAIVYSLNSITNLRANGNVYKQDRSYDITVIDEDPESKVAEKLSVFPQCRFNRHYEADNLNHDVFTLYF